MFAGPDLHVYLLIHNIDGLMLRGEKAQCALGQLASLPNLHLVASIDHINAPLGACLCVYCCFINFWSVFFHLNLSCAFPSVGPISAEPVQLVVVGVCDVPTLCRGDIVWKLAPGAADRCSRSVLPHTRVTQLDTQCTVRHTLRLCSTVRCEVLN